MILSKMGLVVLVGALEVVALGNTIDAPLSPSSCHVNVDALERRGVAENHLDASLHVDNGVLVALATFPWSFH